MKKITALVLAVLMLLTLAGCGPSYEAAPKTFTNNGFTVTLTEAFTYKGNMEEFTLCYTSNDAAVMVEKTSFTDTPGLEDMQLADVAQGVYDYLKNDGTFLLSQEGDAYTMRYDGFDDDNVAYTYYVGIFKGDTAFWVVHMGTKKVDYIEYQPYFSKWMKTVDVTE